jgi:hypothetical protein
MRWHRRAGSDRDSNPEATRRARMTEDFGSRDEKGGASPFTDMIEATRLTGLGAALGPAKLRPRPAPRRAARNPPARTGPRPRGNPAPGCAR